jgi:hypothetical protein
MNPYFTSQGDDINNGIRGGGTYIAQEIIYNGITNIYEFDLNFVDYVHIISGQVTTFGTNFHDRLNVSVIAQASIVNINNTNNGNCVLYDISGGYDVAHMIIPVNGNIGTHDVNLTEAYNNNLSGPDPIFVSKVIPIPALQSDGKTPNGYWDWIENTGEVIPCIDGNGYYNLYDIPITLLKYVNNVCLYNGSLTLPYTVILSVNHRSGPFLPHWTVKFTFDISNLHTIGDKIIFNSLMVLARRKSTN